MAKGKTAGTRSSKKRRGKGENMTGAKEGKTETRQATMALPTASGDKIVHHTRTIKGWKEKLATVQGHLRNAYKGAKADNVEKDTIDFLLGLERGDPAKYRAEMEARCAGLKAVGAPFQMQIFDTAYSSPVEAAAAKGRQDAEASRFAENTYPEGSAEAKAYSDAYGKVQAERLGVKTDEASVTADESEDEDSDLRSAEQREREPAHAH